MLSLNSYGVGRGTNNNNNNTAHVSLPRLNMNSGGPRGPSAFSCALTPTRPREIRSLGKLELTRRIEHPLYRTTAGYDYGRHLDIPDVALSVPKHSRPAGFTKEFVSGPFKDSSLTSIDKSKLRAECWERKVEIRTKQMKIKYEELQQSLEVKKEQRKRERDARRREMEQRHHAVVVIQSRARGLLDRRYVAQIRHEKATIAAITIQRSYRSFAQVQRAKQALDAKKRDRCNMYARKLQRVGRQFLLREDAKRQLVELRREHAERRKSRHRLRGGQGGGYTIEGDAATVIQRVVRGYVQRREQRQMSMRSVRSSTSSGDAKDDRDMGTMMGTLPARAKPKVVRRTITAMKIRKREKSANRLNL